MSDLELEVTVKHRDNAEQAKAENLQYLKWLMEQVEKGEIDGYVVAFTRPSGPGGFNCSIHGQDAAFVCRMLGDMKARLEAIAHKRAKEVEQQYADRIVPGSDSVN